MSNLFTVIDTFMAFVWPVSYLWDPDFVFTLASWEKPSIWQSLIDQTEGKNSIDHHNKKSLRIFWYKVSGQRGHCVLGWQSYILGYMRQKWILNQRKICVKISVYIRVLIILCSQASKQTHKKKIANLKVVSWKQ